MTIRTRHTITKPEREAFERLERTRQAGPNLQISHAAAARALMNLSPRALQLVWGMITVHSNIGGGNASFDDAVRIMGGRKLAWRTLEELHAVGLMRFNDRGGHELHPLFGSIAHRLYEFAHPIEHDGDGTAVDAQIIPLMEARA